MRVSILKFFKWHLLNVGLPTIAAILTFFFAFLNTPSMIVDDILAKAFSGGDNLIVASIMFVILYYEIDSIETQLKTKWAIETVKCIFITLCIMLAACFGAFKFYSFTSEPQNTLTYSGAVVSISALFFASVCATIVKACLIILEPTGGSQ